MYVCERERERERWESEILDILLPRRLLHVYLLKRMYLKEKETHGWFKSTQGWMLMGVMKDGGEESSLAM